MDSSIAQPKAEEVHLTIEQGDEAASNPGLAFAPIVFDPEAQVAALAIEEAAPVHEDEEAEEAEDIKPDVKPAAEAFHVAAIQHAAVQVKKEEPAEEDSEEEDKDDPYGLGPHRSRSPPASRAQRRSIGATVSMKPRKKTAFFPSR